MLTDRGFGVRNRRINSLDVESYQDFIVGFRDWVFTDLDQAAHESAAKIFTSLRLDANDAPLDAFRDPLARDPLVATRVRSWLSSQQLMWSAVLSHYEQHRDHYLDELDVADESGPGTLELNTGMEVPDYAKHEIHIQPGGYTGNEFGGPLYHYGANAFYKGENDNDQFHIAMARDATLPADGQVKRIVDLGCGIGRMTVALAEQHPVAEVWGLDVGGPLVRYAHKRAIDLGVTVHFAQRLAEDTKFDDNSVDLVTAYILFHEVTLEAARNICAEAYRILRPGGVFDVTDFQTGAARAKRTAYRRFYAWVDHVYNAERWAPDFVRSDFLKTLKDAGFEAERGSNRHRSIGSYIARKPV